MAQGRCHVYDGVLACTLVYADMHTHVYAATPPSRAGAGLLASMQEQMPRHRAACCLLYTSPSPRD
eukprot:1856439-Alexandrium_andersonii.AAC.1